LEKLTKSSYKKKIFPEKKESILWIKNRVPAKIMIQKKKKRKRNKEITAVCFRALGR